MKISCQQENLKSGLSIVGNAVAARHTLPILGSVILSTENGGLTLTSSDLELAVVHTLGGKLEVEGSVAIPYKLLSSLISELPDGLIDLSCAKHSLELKTDNSSARINGQDSKDFPPIPDCSGGQTISIPASELRRAIDLTVFSAAREESRPVLTGVSIQAVEGKLQFAAADGYRLALYTSAVSADDLNVIVPCRTLSVISKLCRGLNGDNDQDVTIQFGKPGKVSKSGKKVSKPDEEGEIRVMEFAIGRTRVVSQLISGTFPDYKQLIPTDFKAVITAGLADFLQAVRVASITARESAGITRLEIDDGHMRVSGRGEEVGDSDTSIPVSVEGEQKTRIAFDHRYLIESLIVLRVLSVSAVTLSVNSESSPCVLHPIGIDGYTHVTMPMFVQW